VSKTKRLRAEYAKFRLWAVLAIGVGVVVMVVGVAS
jgi:hypothetical protein